MNFYNFQVRHGPSFYSCNLTMERDEDGHEDIAVVHLNEDDQGLAAGQFAAFYEGRRCIGSGVILESWDDQGFPVCEKALEIAGMEDKSKLGKPVKIKVKPESDLKEHEHKEDTKIEIHGELRNQRTTAVEQIGETSSDEAITPAPMKWLGNLGKKLLQIF